MSKQADLALWKSRLKPGEQLLWTGQPAQGLSAFAIGPMELMRMLMQLGLAAGVWWVAEGADSPDVRTVLRVAFWALIFSVVTTPAARARRLRNSRYAVTDRRSMVLSGLLRPSRLVELSHKASAPRSLPERWGATVMVGLRISLVSSLTKWLWWFGDGTGNRNAVMFQRLNPMDSPLDLLKQLHQPGGMPFALRALTVMGTKL